MAIAGLRGTGSWSADERPKNFRETILWLNPNGVAPLTALLSKMSEESTDDPEFAWFEETLGHVRVQVTANALATDTTLTVSGALNLVKGDILLAESDDGQAELMEVTADPTSDTSVTVARGIAGSTAADITAPAYLTKIGNAHEEGARAPKATTRNPTKRVNYCQIFRTVYNLTNTATKTRLRTGDPVKNDKKRKMFDHARDMELSFLFGRPYEDLTGSQPKRYTGGLNNFISTNRRLFTSTDTMTEDKLIDAIAPVFDYDGAGAGDERLAFCGNGALTALNKVVRNSASTRINFDQEIRVYGMRLQRLILPQGVIYFRTHPLMNVHPVFTNSMFIINPRGLKYRYLRDTKPRDNIQLPDEDQLKGEWITEAGLEVQHERTMAYIGGMNNIP